MKKRLLSLMALGLCLLVNQIGLAANTKTSVAQVTGTVTLSTDVDYTVTSATPFGNAGVVNITNTDHAVLILSNVRPSAALSLLSAHVQINGARAVNNTNCQVKLYNLGCIILPYGTDTKPLTVYSEQNFQGESCNDFGLENTGGYMNTLTTAKLNNKIRSFKLKRGYMVTFANHAGGRGYSRCFIAADQDLEIAVLPDVMDQKISSYRVFNWYDAGKKQIANNMNRELLTALNVQSSYDWGQGNSSFLPDFEWVPNHIYEDWPSSAAIGSTTQSPHTKNNNEPRNTADDHPQDLATILGNWENMMRTGMRLCSPSSWDGSDYWNATGFLAEFMDSIDARGWRCDILDLHCYWVEGSFGNIANWVNKYHRPVWISEWCWGASWNNNGAFANGVTQAQVKTALQSICTKLNSWDYVERYYYWNNERDISKLYLNGELTPAGEYYASMNSGLAYNGKYDYVPNTPKQYAPSQFSSTVVDGKRRLTWYDPNGEFNRLMEVQKKDQTGKWVTYADITIKETAATYTFDISDDIDAEYRVHIIDLNGKEYYTSEEISAGDQLEVNGTTKYLGGNMFRNSDFDLGFAGWTNGKGDALSAPAFQVVKAGGVDNGAYLQAYNTGDLNSEYSVKNIVDLEANTDYYVRTATRNGNVNQKFSLTTTGIAENKIVLSLANNASWTRMGEAFNSGTYTKGMMAFRNLLSRGQMDKVELRRLFDTREEAVADGVVMAKAEAELTAACNTTNAALRNELTTIVSSVSGSDDQVLVAIEQAIANHQKALRSLDMADSLKTVLSALSAIKCPNYDGMMAALDEAAQSTEAAKVIALVDEVKHQMDTYLDFADAATQPQSPKFALTTGWTVKCGTYTDGDQRTNTTADGKTCWNAWWSLSATANPTATMEVKQTVKNLTQGIYTLECKATTEHYCLSDQHGYMQYDGQTMETPHLTYDYFDLPVNNIWETLTTAPILVKEGGQVTIGFVGSKQGATDGLWHRLGSTAAGDNREGWWCATDFVLKYHPAYTREAEVNQWGTICRPYTLHASDEVKLYKIVGINPEYTQLCVQEIDESPAGVPCLYKATTVEPLFYEYGTTVSSPIEGPCNLRGFFVTSSSAPKDYFTLQNGTFTRVFADRPKIGSYNAILRPFADRSSTGIPVLETWDGPTVPIEGVTEADKEANAAGISLPLVDGKADGYYTLDGRQLTDEPSKGGLFIKVENGKAQKVIIR